MKIDIRQISFYHPHLRTIITWLEKETGFEFTITSEHRDDGGIHDTIPLRAVDIRMRNRAIGYAVGTFIDEHWIYDPKRPHKSCVLMHGKGSNFHLHLQVHDNTVGR